MGQFAIPAAILGVAIIGYWLLGPKSPTTNPDKMPALNAANRGQGVTVSFGTNKLAAQVAWVNKFRAVRQGGSGKGGSKGGGSGGFGSAKGGANAATGYLYYWDMMFQYGIMDQPSMIRQGWVGTDRIFESTLSDLTAGASDVIRSQFSTHDQTGVANSATLHYTQSFVAPGYPTGSTDLESWSYFVANSWQQQPCMFPYNAWVGFEQLELGQSPSVPQLSFEWAPIPSTGGFEFNNAFASTVTSTTEGVSTLSGCSNSGLVLGDNGKHYYLIITNTNSIHIVCCEDGTHLEVSQAQFKLDLATKGMTPPTGTAYSDYLISGAGTIYTACNGTPYLWIVACIADGGLGYGYMGLRYKIDSSGTLVIDGGLAGLTDFLTAGLASSKCAAVHGNTVYVYCSNTSGLQLIGLPLTGDLTANVAAWTALWTDFTPSANFFDFQGQNRTGLYYACIAMQPNGSYDILMYVGQAELDYITSNVAHASAWAAITSVGVYKINSGSVTKLTDFVIDDAKKHKDGTASSNYYDDYSTGPTSFIQGGVTYLALNRGYSSDVDNAPSGTRSRMRLYTWDGSTGTDTGSIQGEPFDTVADLGFSEANRYNVAPPNQVIMYVSGTDGVIRFVWQDFFGELARHVFGVFASNTHAALDVTPAYIVYRILTSDVFGFDTSALYGYTISTDRVDQASYAAAVQWCVDQGIYVSIAYNNGGDLLSILNELLALYGGFLTDYDGMIHFGIVTGTDVPVRTIDNSHLVADQGQPPITTTKASVDDGYNVVIFNYLDRDLDYSKNQVQVADEVDYDINGPRVLEYQPSFTMNGSVAYNIAYRALWANLYGKDSYSFKLGRKDADLVPGALITLVDSFDPLLSGGVRARIVKWKESKRLQFDVTAVREYPQLITGSSQFTQATSAGDGFGTLVQSVVPMRDFRAYELPHEFQGSKAEVYFGYNQGSLIMGAQLYLSTGGSYVLTQDVQPYAISGILPAALEARPQGWCEDNVELYIFAASGFSIATPTFVQTYDLDDVSQALRASGAGVLIVGSEAVSVEDLTLLAQNRYRARRLYRGWGGTPIAAHNSGDFFHMHQAGIFAHEITQDDIGTSFSYKVVPYNFAGDPYNVASISARTYTVVGDFWRPRLQGRSRIYVQGAISWPSSSELGGPFVGVVSGGCDVVLTWPNPSNTDGFGAGGYGGGTYGHFADGASNWRVDVASKNGTKVSSFLVTSTYFSYNRAQNSADFNGFARDLILNITPYTVKGDGFADVRSLSMNW